MEKAGRLSRSGIRAFYPPRRHIAWLYRPLRHLSHPPSSWPELFCWLFMRSFLLAGISPRR